MKILVHSNAPWAPTGYGQQCAQLTERLRRAGHDVAVSATWGLQGGEVEWNGMRVYPADDKWGNRTLGAVTAHFADGDPVLVITLADVWVFEGPQFDEIAAWTPVDHAPTPPNVAKFFAQHPAARPVAMSRFGERLLRQDGLDPLYAPHGIDTAAYKPSGDAAAVREHLKIPRDAFVVGMVAANKGLNPPRKAFPQLFTAFGEFARRHDDAFLYMHTEFVGVYGGINLVALANACKIPPDRIKITNPFALELGLDHDRMADLYSSFDVFANPSYGEGFGIPIVEAQACGTPVIVTDWTAMTELCGAGWLVDGDPWYDATQGSFYKCPAVGDLFDAMERAYERRGDQELRERAREFALSYDADRVFDEHWQPVLGALTTAPAEPGREGAEVFVRRAA